MKVFKIVAAAFVAVTLSVSVNAQEKQAENRDENGKFLRGPYVTNKFGDNWFVGAAGGVNIFMNSAVGYSGRVGAALDIYAGKWFTPGLGLRLGYQGLTGRMNGQEFAGSENKELEKFQFFYLHGDVMWNISNTIGGYKESRFWNFVPYVHAGAMHIFAHENPAAGEVRNNSADNEVAFGCGLYNTLRFSKRVYGTIDVRETMLSPRFHSATSLAGNTDDRGGICSDLSATIGIGVYLGKVGWDRVGKNDCSNTAAALAAAEAALLAAKEANDALNSKNNELADDNKALAEDVDRLNKDLENAGKNNQVYINDTTYVEFKLGTAPCTLFFALNSATLNATELQHLDFYVKNIISQDPDHVFYLTGNADAATGSDETNAKLSRQRVENVRNLIIDKYGIDADKLVIKDARISNTFSDPRLDRSVIIEH